MDTLEELVAALEDHMVVYVQRIHSNEFDPNKLTAYKEMSSIAQEVEKMVMTYQAWVKQGIIQKSEQGMRLSQRIYGLIKGMDEIKGIFIRDIVNKSEVADMVRTRRQVAAAAAAAPAAPAVSKFARLRSLIGKKLVSKDVRRVRCGAAGRALKMGNEAQRKAASAIMLRCKREKRSGKLVWM